ncbi:uncharacterized protein LOC122402734 [Colletes gigas]|uniref:uncharacterized protein LOC122402734 n=1 Tax=Colletes gigas TaxID=935657 RepID=UPI001C9A2F72|nr:uncharacterized protein LOC122402734 [Colletes gigas]
MCSANITRQNLNQRSNISTPSDDDDEFFQKLKSEIDKDLLSHSKENYKPNTNYQDIALLKKKRPIIDEETQNVIKRFKKDTKLTNFTQTLGGKSNMQSNYVVKTHDVSTNTVAESRRRKDIFTSNILNENLRDPLSKYIFQMSSKVQQNDVLPLSTNEAAVTCIEYEEFQFYAMTYLTPPNNK